MALSRWFVLVVCCSAVYVACGKRLAELVRAIETGRRPRAVLRAYTASGLRSLLAASGACALLSYCMWAFAGTDVDSIPWRMLTVIPFTTCLWRYGTLALAGSGEAPEEALLSDRTLGLAGVSWLVLFVLSVDATV